MDALLDTDWAAQWRALVETRAALTSRPGQDDFWDRLAPRFAQSIRTQVEPFLDFVEPWLGPGKTLIDVGAGAGRHTGPLAGRLDWVTAVEPSQGMRDHIPPADNMTVIASTWEDAEPARADLVICVHVLYGVAQPVPFIEKLERSARERVFLVLRDGRHSNPADATPAARRGREPGLRDGFLLLRQLGVAADVSMFVYPVVHRYESLEDAAEHCRMRLGRLWDEDGGRAWLEANLEHDEDGTLVYRAEVTSGVLHWKPRA